MTVRSLLVVPLCLGLACSSRPVHVVRGCSPLQTTGDECFGPFPNAWYEAPDATTPTGYKVTIPTGVLPATSSNQAFDTSIIGNEDGFSPSTQIVAYFQQGVDPTQLTPTPTSPYADRIELMMQPHAPIVLLDVAAKERVPFFAELDANASAGQRQALLIHPMIRLKTQTRYAVAILNTLHDSSGNALAPAGQFAEWVQGNLEASDSLYEISDRLDDDASALSAVGVEKKSLALAWDFDTASDSATTGQLETMVQQALAVPAASLTYTIDSAEPDAVHFPNAAKVVIGTFQAPSFEAGPDPSPLNYDASHTPIMGAPANWRFVADIPSCALTAPGPVPLVIVGHGLLETAWTELSDDDSHGIFNDYCMVAIGTNWVGFSGMGPSAGQPPDEPDDFAILAQVLSDPNEFDLVSGRLQQAHVNFQVLTRLAMGALASDPALSINGGAPSYDPSTVYYWGASNGGIQGTTFLALSNVVNRGVLNVPGADWSLLMWRSYDFVQAVVVLQLTYPDPLDQQVMTSLIQQMFDKTDPIEFSPHLVGTSKQVLFQESEGDAEVTNLATRQEMRTIGAQPLAPMLDPDYGFTAVTGPLSGLVYTQWTVNPTPWPACADTPAAENGAHDDMRWQPEVIAQAKQFLQPGGLAVNTDTNPIPPIGVCASD